MSSSISLDNVLSLAVSNNAKDTKSNSTPSTVFTPAPSVEAAGSIASSSAASTTTSSSFSAVC